MIETRELLNRYWHVALIFLLVVQAVLVLAMLHRETLTLDEADHSYSGYRMWHDADFGINPEHPPLVKLVATIPLLGRSLWLPTLQTRHFKTEAYVGGRDFWERNDGPAQRLFTQVRAALLLFALGMVVGTFFLARALFGVEVGLLAAAIAVFEPNLMAHSGRVTTDMGLVCMVLWSLLAFWKMARKPTIGRALLCGLAVGAVLGSKHSGVLIVPMLLVLAMIEIANAKPRERVRALRLLTGGLAVTFAVALLVLWGLYGFRFAMRPAGLTIIPSFAEYLAGIPAGSGRIVAFVEHWHLLPQSYLMGLIDIKTQEQSNPAFLLGRNYAHGVWWYFPTAFTIKATLGMLGLLLIALWALVKGKLGSGLALLYLAVPAAIYLAVSMAGHMNIGIRHVLLIFPLAAIFCAAGAVSAFTAKRSAWSWTAALCLVFHAGSSLSQYPNEIAYANEAWGGGAQVHRYLSDSSVDWGQQLYGVKRWVDSHPGEECWFAYVGRPYLNPKEYGIACRPLPNIASAWLSEWTEVPPRIHGTVLVSADNLEGCEWPSRKLNPYDPLRSLPIAAEIQHGVLVFQGDLDVHEIAGLSAAQRTQILLARGDVAAANVAAKQAVDFDPESIAGQTSAGDAAFAAGHSREAKAAYAHALRLASELEPEAREEYVPDLQAKLSLQGTLRRIE